MFAWYMRGPICFAAANEEGDGRVKGGRGHHFGAGRGSTTKIVLFHSTVWLNFIELQSCCCNSDWPLIDLRSDGERQHD